MEIFHATGNPDVVVDDSWATTPASFKMVCKLLIEQATIVSVGFVLKRTIRDRCGFCEPIALSGQLSYLGFSDDYQRPRLLCMQQDLTACGNDLVVLPSGTKLRLPIGSFFIDADDYNALMIEQSIRVRL